MCGNVDADIEEGTLAEGVWEQDAENNIWA